MPAGKVTREDIFRAAHEININRGKVTVPAIREKLGAGSFGTIHKYLKEWQSTESGDELHVEVDSPSIPYIYGERLEKEKLELEKEVEGLEDINEKLIKSFNQEKLKTKSLKTETETLKNKCIELEQNLKLKDERLNNFEKLVGDLKAQHEIAVDKILKETGARISDLMHELKDTIIGSEKEARDMSTELNDRILTERAKVQNLEIALGQKEKKIKQLESRAVDEDLLKKIKRLSDENASLVGKLSSAGVL